MRKILLSLTMTAVATTSLMATTEIKQGEAIFEKVCSGCHTNKRPETKAEKITFNGPTVMGITKHVKRGTDGKEEFVNFVTEYIVNPDIKKSLCKEEVLDAFGVMPSMKGAITKEESKLVAEYMYETYGNYSRGKGKGKQ